MPRKIIKRYMPDTKAIKEHRHLQCFGDLLHDHNLWGLNRRSVSMAFFIGVFWALIAIPFQMFFSAATAIYTRANLPISVALVWITNPITIPPIFYFCYMFGTWLLPSHHPIEKFELSLEWISNSMGDIWLPLYLGGIVLGLLIGALSYLIIRGLWRLRIVQQYKERKARRHSKRKQDRSD